MKTSVLFRPQRYRYVTKAESIPGCVFCRLLKGSIKDEGLLLHKTQLTMIVLNKFPYNSGHLLVLPLRHVGHLWDLNPEEYNELSLWLLRCAQMLKTEYRPNGLNIGMNHGSAAGAGLPDHLHWHVIPRWEGDTNFFPLIAQTKVLAETLDQVYKRLRPYFLEA